MPQYDIDYVFTITNDPDPTPRTLLSWTGNDTHHAARTAKAFLQDAHRRVITIGRITEDRTVPDS